MTGLHFVALRFLASPLNPARDSSSAPRRQASTPSAAPSVELAAAARSEPEMSATAEGEWGSTLPGAQIDASTTDPGTVDTSHTRGPMATTQIEALPLPGEVRPSTHPPGMLTTAFATLSDGKGARASSRASTLTPGTLIDGKYRLEALLGKGGMGIVWRAEHAHLHGSIAIKFLLDRFRAKPQVIERFRQEATVMGELGHPNIARVYDISSTSSDMPYLTMELLEQGSLREYLKRSGGRLPPEEACELLDGVLSALIAAHKRGIVHRDIKPDNLMLATVRSFETDMNEVQLKILDFGASLLLADNSDINTTEGLMGTPYYMSPEQASGAPLDQRTDLYSAAVVLYEAISGKLPHTGEDVHSLVYSIATEEPTPISQYAPKLPRPYREFFARALAVAPARRFQSAEDMRQAMRALSPRLSGKNRNTALYLASGDTGPIQLSEAGSRPDTQPMRSFRDVLEDPSRGDAARPPAPTATASRPLAPAVAIGVAVVLALGPALAMQWARFGAFAQAPMLDTGFAWAACAAVAGGLAWHLTRRT